MATWIELVPADWKSITIAANPFKAAGAAVCDPTSSDEDMTYVRVGITKNVISIVRSFLETGKSQHFAVGARLGYGKSRSFAAAMQLAADEYPTTLCVYIKFSSYRTRSSGAQVQTELVREIIAQVSHQIGNTPKALASRMDSASAGSVSHEMVPTSLSKALGNRNILILIDEIEKLIESPYMPKADVTAVLNLFKSWADRSKKRVSIGLALTPPALEWILTNFPDVTQRFDVQSDLFGFLQEETEEFMLQKCMGPLGVYGKAPFSSAVITLIHNLSEGIPRVIESIAHEAWNYAAIAKSDMKPSDFAKLVNDVYGLAVKEVCRTHGMLDPEISLVKDLLCRGGHAALRELRDPDSDGYRTLWRRLYQFSQRGLVVGRRNRGYYVLPNFMDDVMRKKYGGFHGGV
jgi:hypothetical protein